MKVLIVVTHLLGSGHLVRALNLAEAFEASGHAVTVVSGGTPMPQLASRAGNLVQLPPVRSDGVNFRTLLDADGAPVSEETMAKRQEQLLTTLRELKPDLLITELFPFGRRILAAEFDALLAAAQNQSPAPVVCASIRDILAPPSKPAKAEAVRHRLQTYYDAVLVHSDPDLTPLEISWPVTPDIAAKLHYTGFVAPLPAEPANDGQGDGEVLVTTGGGPVGMRLFETALSAATLQNDRPWRLLVGGEDAAKRINALRELAPTNATVSEASPTFRRMLYNAAASVSFCGYNTALDILQAGTPAVFVPFEEGGEVEQTLRASSFSHLPGVAVLSPEDLSPHGLLKALENVVSAPRRAPRRENQQGAYQSVEIAQKLVAGKHG